MQRAGAKIFEEKQGSDKSLKAWLKLADDNESEFCVVNGLLYMTYQILFRSFSLPAGVNEREEDKVKNRVVLHSEKEKLPPILQF